MSGRNKKKKLSLKKSSPKKSDDAEQQSNTIISMFKKQKEKQVINVENEVEPDRQAQSEGSEGDVVITKVESIGSHNLLRTSGDNSDTNRSTDSKNKLSLSKGKKRKSELEDDEFQPSKSKYFSRKSISEEGNKSDSTSRYNLRKSKTHPVIDLSDSEDLTINEADAKDIHVEANLSQKENVEEVSSDEKRDTKPKHKLSLKKNKTEGDVPTQSDATLKRVVKESCKDERASGGHAIIKKIKPQGVDRRKSAKAEMDKHTLRIRDAPNERYEANNKGHNKVLEDTNSENDWQHIKHMEFDQDNESASLMDKDNNGKINLFDLNAPSDCLSASKSDEHIITIPDSHSPIKQDTSVTPVATYSIFKPQKLTKLTSQDSSQNKTSAAKHPTKTKMSKKTKTSDTSEDIDDNEDGDSKPDNQEKDDDTTEAEPLFRVPYYLENFRTILDTVLSDKENSRLFNETDMKYVSAFNTLEEPAQKLYVRLFSRRLAWLPMTKISYPEISDNMEELVDILIGASLLISGEDLTDLTQILRILAAPDLKALAKSFHLNIAGATKKQIVEMLLKKSQQSSISAMFKGGTAVSTEKTMLTRAKSFLGRLCRLHEESRAVFIRILMLFSLYNTNLDEESGGGGQNQLFQMLMANIGHVVYPSYTINRQRSVFKERDAVIRFETALMFELEIQTFTEKNKWADAYDVYKQAKEIGRDICRNKEFLDWDLGLPLFLRSYTAGTIYTRIDNQGVEILQRLRKYKEAVQLLEELLSQSVYCPEYRGHWYDRLALNLDAHLKQQNKCLEVIKTGLSDPEVRPSRRFLLYQRAEKICTAPSSKFSSKLADIEPVKVTESPEHYVDGMVMPDATSMGMKYQFVLSGGEEGVTLCAVEELALEHYKENGYPEGLHAEGSIISNLFVLFFWDIEFMDIPDVFHSPFQSQPLDMMTTDFYVSRQQLVDDRLEWLKMANVESLVTEVGDIWEKHNGKMCAGINWEKFTGPQKLQGLVSCMGGKIIAGILERYVKDPRHTRSGFPDLTLWNTENKTFKISEVKGPGDRLSHKQILWLDYLLGLGVDAEVCYVKAVGSKKLKPVARKS